MTSAKRENAPPYTRSTAHSAGWQWRIPLQHRFGNGFVFSNDWMDEEVAREQFINSLGDGLDKEPRLLKFTAGRRACFWKNNCVALGLASGFMEPLESTSIHLVQSALSRLLALFPTGQGDQNKQKLFNERSVHEYETIRDFLILHYYVNERRGEPFWEYCASMPIPEYLQNKLALYRESGQVFRENDELFGEVSWLAVMHGQGVHAAGCHSLVNDEEARLYLAKVDQLIDRVVDAMPGHQQYLEAYC